MEAQSLSLTNDGGRWTGSGTAIQAGETWAMTAVLTGQGAYDGLTAYVTVDWYAGTLVGAIFPGPMPSAPPAG